MVIIPRDEYDAMRRSLQDRFGIDQNSTLDGDLAKSLAEYQRGKYYGPFYSAKDGVAFLKSHKRQAPKK